MRTGRVRSGLAGAGRIVPVGFTVFVKGNLIKSAVSRACNQIIEDRNGSIWVADVEGLGLSGRGLVPARQGPSKPRKSPLSA